MVNILAKIAYLFPIPNFEEVLFLPRFRGVFAVGKFVVVLKMWSKMQKIAKTFEKLLRIVEKMQDFYFFTLKSVKNN